MERLTVNKPVSEMSMMELAHNCCYISEDGNARYRDYESDIDAREFTRQLMRIYEGEYLSEGDTEFDEEVMTELKYDPEIYSSALIALFYRNMWAMAELRSRLKYYEDAEEQGLLLRLPCKVGSHIWVNGVLGCGEAEEYKVIRVDYHSILGTQRNEFYIEALLVRSPEGNSIGFYDKEIGKTVFLTKEEAERKLAEMKGE